MAIYTVQDTTMTALGDAVRKQTTKYVGKEEKNEPFFTYHFDSRNYDLVSGYNTIYFNPYSDYIGEINDIFDVCEGTFTYQANTFPSPRIKMSVPIQPNGYSYGSLDFILNNVNQNTVNSVDSYSSVFNTGFYYDVDWSLQIVMDSEVPSDIEFSFDIELRALTSDNQYIGLNTYTPNEMIDIINDWDISAIDRYKKCIIGGQYEDIASGIAKSYSIPSSDFIGVSQIGVMSFIGMENIKGVEFPEGLIKIKDQAFADCISLVGDIVLPRTLTELGGRAFGNTKITSVRILNDTTPLKYSQNVSINSTWSPFYNCNKLTTIYVPSKLYYDYMDSYLGAYHSSLITPYGEWVFDKNLSTYLAYSNEKEYSISLQDFTSTPDFSITLDKNECAEITDISIKDDNTEIIFKVKALNSEGVEELTVIIYGEEQTFTLTGTITVMETVPEPTYEVVAVDGASYGFTLNDNVYYESQNKGKSSTYALCQVNISNPIGLPVYFDCINSGEANYDYGILGAVNQTLSKSTTDDSGVKKNFKGLSSANIQTVEYTDAIGDCFIQLKYKKDGSGDQGNDTLQFQIRFGE